MSLLAAFVAMLGKQWLSRYLRHRGGSMVERCGDRQRKCDGLERWPFRLIIESLPVMLQIALFLLASGLSQHMWSINSSVAQVIISFTVLGILFYIGVVVAGTSSYECPFQTPASTALRYLGGTTTTQKLLTSLSPPRVILLICATLRNTKHGFILVSHHTYNTIRHPMSWGISLSHIISSIHIMATNVGHKTIILLLQIDRAFDDARQRLGQAFQGFWYTTQLPVTIRDMDYIPHIPQGSPGLLLHVWNVGSIQRQNMDSAYCVCWVLWNITDPEAIESAIHLAGTIQWFYGNSDYNLPFNLVISTFEACFDSTKLLYPGTRDQAYFSAQAILQISMRARAQSHEHASKYPVPAVSQSKFEHTDPDLHHAICMLRCNFGPGRPTFIFPRGGTNTHTHSLWMSNLLVDVTHAGPNPILKSCQSYFSAAITNHQVIIANTLLMWYIFLGGHVEEETLWAANKLYVEFSLLLPAY